MELFDELYSSYYKVVHAILAEAAHHPITENRMKELMDAYAFEESFLYLMKPLTDGTWPLLEPAGSRTWKSRLTHEVHPPCSLLQKQWLCSLLQDPRISLFLSDEDLEHLKLLLGDTEPLYNLDDFHYFDRFLDGDDYQSPAYRAVFRTIRQALTEKHRLRITYKRRGDIPPVTHEIAPCFLQYSSKNDKFRLCGWRMTPKTTFRPVILNVSRILNCQMLSASIPENLPAFTGNLCKEPVLIEISGERNSLERSMLHFASYAKHTEYIPEKDVYHCSIYYDLADETELLIQILSFGPVIKVLGPEAFLKQIRRRVARQHRLFTRPL